MSFSIVLQTNNSDKIKLDKTITDLITLTGTLKQETSIVDPVILIDGDISSFIYANYCTIPTFGRSYFINNIRSIRASLFEISCHVDVLSSFKTQIRANKAIIHKSERNWNLYLNDGSLKTRQDPDLITEQFSNGEAFVNHFSYVLVLAG